MRKRAASILIFLALIQSSASAETLIAPLFPEKGVWNLATEKPITAQDGNTVGKMAFYFLSSDDANAPRNLVTTTEMNRSPSTSPYNYVTNHARALQQSCEALQLTRPTHSVERGVPVSYARVYCARLKGKDTGMIQTVKALQGREKLYMVVRQWNTPRFTFDVPLDREQFPKSVFGSSEAASEWLAQMESANKHLEQEVTLCSNKSGEFGAPCSGK